jgi:hypothetical protein
VRSISLISDVMIRDGVVYVMGSRPTDTGEYHMDRFTVTGNDLGSVVLYEPRIRLPDEVRIVSPGGFLAFNSVSGVIARLGLQESAPPR